MMELPLFSKFLFSNVIVIASFVKLCVAVFTGSDIVIFGQFLRGKGYAQLYRSSLAECIISCRVRARCQSVNYLRQSSQCRLNAFTDNYESRLESRAGVLFILLKDFSERFQVFHQNMTFI